MRGIEDDRDPAAAQRRDAAPERRVAGQGHVRPRHGDDWQALAGRLVEQAQRQCVADPGRPLVDGVEGGRGGGERAGGRQDIRGIRIFEACANRMAGQLGDPGDVEDLVIAATAELAGLTVLHFGKDFEVIADVTGQPVERLSM